MWVLYEIIIAWKIMTIHKTRTSTIGESCGNWVQYKCLLFNQHGKAGKPTKVNKHEGPTYPDKSFVESETNSFHYPANTLSR